MLHLDQQIAKFQAALISDVGLTSDESTKVATYIATDIRFLPKEIKDSVSAASWVPLHLRLEALGSFQRWSDFAIAERGKPDIVRAAVVVQTYICFVYLKDACFEALGEQLPSTSVTSRCAVFLSRGKVRDFRNAFSHGNWCHRPNVPTLDCWVACDARNPNGVHRHFEVSNEELDFWQTLSRGVAYVTYDQLGR